MSTTVMFARVVAGALLSGLWLGCSTEEEQEHVEGPMRQATEHVEPTGESHGPGLSPRDSHERWVDGAVALAVRRELDRSSGIPAQRIQSTVEQGIVTLTGEVQTGAQASRAVELLERTRGVRAVINRLSISGASRPESELVADIRGELEDALAGAAAGVNVDAKGGNVELRGEVPSLTSKQNSERAAWSVYGVTAVDDQQLTVVPKVERSDAQIQADIASRLKSDSNLYGQPVKVSVTAGVVSLTGEVDTGFARRRIHGYATVAGVREIHDDGLLVSHTSGWGKPALGIPTAEETEAAIRNSFRLDPRAPDFGIHVHAQDGQVALTGVVAALPEKIAAGEDAVNASGIWLVSNQLQVRPSAPFTDAQLRQAVLNRLLEHPYVAAAARQLRVNVTDGVVVLSGNVESAFQGDEAERAATFVPGVVSVENETRLGATSSHARSDQDILGDLEHSLQADPRVDSSKLRVQVRDGVVTVSGTVENWATYDAIVENVYKILPRRFDDRLSVREPIRVAQLP